MLIETRLTLVANPYPNTPCMSQAMVMPLVTERDFASMGALPSGDVAILLNHEEHYRLLDGLLQLLWQATPELQILLRMQMPAGGRMPRSFLDERVLMVQDVADEESRWQPHHGALLVIDDHLPRYPLEAGDNTTRLRLHHQDESAASTCMQQATEYFLQHAFRLEQASQ